MELLDFLIVIVIIFLTSLFYFKVLLPFLAQKYFRNIINKGILSDFIHSGGFQSIEDKFIEGTFKAYYVYIIPHLEDVVNKRININIVFEPLNKEKEKLTKNNNHLNIKYRNNYSFFLNEINTSITYQFNTITYEDLIVELNAMIKILASEKLQPISNLASEKLQEGYNYFQEIEFP